jgi:probable phosphoglycerate mutase
MVAVVSHADLIKMVLAHYLGMHLDNFQRLVISPASISSLMLSFGRPYIVTMNDIAHVLQIDREKKQKQSEEVAVAGEQHL